MALRSQTGLLVSDSMVNGTKPDLFTAVETPPDPFLFQSKPATLMQVTGLRKALLQMPRATAGIILMFTATIEEAHGYFHISRDTFPISAMTSRGGQLS
jgi:hypothetical protein